MWVMVAIIGPALLIRLLINIYINKVLIDIDIRKEMIVNALEEFKLFDRVNIVDIDRPEYYPDEFNRMFDIEKYDLFFPQISKEDTCFDSLRNQAFEKILRRKIHIVKPPLTIHLSQIQEQYNINKDKLFEYLPKYSCYILERYATDILKTVNERNV